MATYLRDLPRSALNNRIILTKHMKRTEKNLSIHYRTKFSNILAIELSLIRYLKLVTAIYLRPACKSRLYVICAVFVPFRSKQILIPKTRTRTYNGHIAYENIPDLWKLIKAMRPYKLADLGYVLIRIVEHMRRHIMGRTHFHRSEFMELKILFILPYSFLSKKYRTRIFDFYC